MTNNGYIHPLLIKYFNKMRINADTLYLNNDINTLHLDNGIDIPHLNNNTDGLHLNKYNNKNNIIT